jgi:Golgi nucleoside diphosphatase
MNLFPGLSNFEDDPDKASDHIKELLLFAQDFIPKHKHRETPLYVLATAGMRMIPRP